MLLSLRDFFVLFFCFLDLITCNKRRVANRRKGEKKSKKRSEVDEVEEEVDRRAQNNERKREAKRTSERKKAMPPASPAMAAPAAAAADGDPAAAPAAQPNPIFGLLRMLAIWWLFRAFFNGGGGKSGPGGAAKSTSQLARSDYFLPLLQRATPVDVAMVLSEDTYLSPGWIEYGGTAPARPGDAAQVVWRESAVPLAATSASGEKKVTVSYTPSEVSFFWF